MNTVNPAQLSAFEAAEAIRDGSLRSEELVQACLDRVDAVDADIQAWAFLDRDYVLEQARRCDGMHVAGLPKGPLHGVPVALKDIIDTADMPTENGTVLHEGRRPTEDAAIVSTLRQAGAVIMGKTVTTELATYHPGKTRNPHDPTRTPGGSSSGSAAGVASFQFPLAVGSQTNGSVLRPASFCGVWGFKPTRGLVSRVGVLSQSPFLDILGYFARDARDVALITEILAVYDARDPQMRPRARPALTAVATSEPPATPRFAFVRGPVWDQADDDAKEAIAELADFLGDAAEEVELPSAFADAIGWHGTIMEADIARSYASLYERGAEKFSESLRSQIERGRKTTAIDYNDAMSKVDLLNYGLIELFEQFDAILTLPATGEASVGDATGSPIFCTIWTLCGTPAVTVPLMQGSDGMPIGAQLVGRPGDDARLLRTASWLARRVDEA
ncbi:MAG: amidase [Alphaproteobacteria bacterium]|nr:amidase [Alphaproteobacteria bacterium]